MKKLLALALLVCLLCGCGGEKAAPVTGPEHTPAAEPTPVPTPTPTSTPTPEPTPTPLAAEPGRELLRFDCAESGDYLDYWLGIPENAAEGMPLLVFLHGDGNRAWPESLENNAIQKKIVEIYGGGAPFITLMPNTRLYSWTESGVEKSLIALINHVAETYNCDRSRIMLTGHSRGAIGTWYYISEYTEMFSAAAPVSCGCDEALDYEAMSAVPVWGFCGDLGQDGTHYLPAMQRIAEGIRAAGGSAEIELLTGCDHASAEGAAYTEELFEWLLSQ